MTAIEKQFDGRMESIPKILDFIDSFTTKHTSLDSIANQLQVVGDEIFSNIIKYGYEDKGGPIDIKLSFDENQNEFILIIIDKAKQFNQLSINVDNEEAKILRYGGLGISIVKKIMSDCSYSYINGQNILTLKKKA